MKFKIPLSIKFYKLWVMSMLTKIHDFNLNLAIRKGFLGNKMERLLVIFVGVIFAVIGFYIYLQIFASTLFATGTATNIVNITKNITDTATAKGGISATIAPYFADLLIIGTIGIALFGGFAVYHEFTKK